MKTDRRVKDLVRIGVISLLLGGIFLLLGFNYFDKQGCKKGYFERDGIECLSCTSYLGD